MIKSNKGQIALEALVIFGILVVGSIIFGLFYMNNVRDILVEGPGTKQDKNGGGDIYDDLEGSLVYNEEDQIGSSSIGMSDGSGGSGDGGGDTDGDGDTETTYCGDGTCNGSETLLNCFLDCSAGYYLGGIYLALTPEGPIYPSDKITINATFESDAPSAQITELNIQKFDYGNNSFNNSDDCGLTGYDNNYSYFNVGELLPIYYGYLNDSFDFFCNPGTYRFTFYVSNGTDTIENEVDKMVLEPPMQFISVWNTDFEGSALSESDEIILPVISTGTYDFDVDWGDGITSHISNDDPRIPLYYFDGVNNEYIGPAKHQYARPGIYTVAITGTIDGFNFVRPDLINGIPLDAKKLIEISQWGPLRLGHGGQYFSGAENLTITATDLLDTSDVTDMSSMFADCYSLTEVPRINEWNTSNVTNTYRMFYNAINFNQPLSFNTSNVTDMSYMFNEARAFNSTLDFNTAKVITMQDMFYLANSFNKPVNFNTKNVKNMSGMFRGAISFNQSINFNTQNVTNMSLMFAGAESFNTLINTSNCVMRSGPTEPYYCVFDTNRVTDMSEMFSIATSFNQPLNLNTSNVTNMAGMFNFATSFNQPLVWNTGNVTNMYIMFQNATAFNQNISNWDVDNVTVWNNIFIDCPIQSDYKPSKFR